MANQRFRSGCATYLPLPICHFRSDRGGLAEPIRIVAPLLGLVKVTARHELEGGRTTQSDEFFRVALFESMVVVQDLGDVSM